MVIVRQCWADDERLIFAGAPVAVDDDSFVVPGGAFGGNHMPFTDIEGSDYSVEVWETWISALGLPPDTGAWFDVYPVMKIHPQAIPIGEMCADFRMLFLKEVSTHASVYRLTEPESIRSGEVGEKRELPAERCPGSEPGDIGSRPLG
jgi:hypothetical protein